MERVLGEYEIDTVFHLAAQTIVGVANRNPLSTFETNMRGTWTLLEACRRSPHSCASIVVASSDKAYGDHDELPYTEDAPLRGATPTTSASRARTYRPGVRRDVRHCRSRSRAAATSTAAAT